MTERCHGGVLKNLHRQLCEASGGGFPLGMATAHLRLPSIFWPRLSASKCWRALFSALMRPRRKCRGRTYYRSLLGNGFVVNSSLLDILLVVPTESRTPRPSSTGAFALVESIRLPERCARAIASPRMAASSSTLAFSSGIQVNALKSAPGKTTEHLKQSGACGL